MLSIASSKKSNSKQLEHLIHFQKINPSKFKTVKIERLDIVEPYGLKKWQEHFGGIYFKNNRKIRKNVYRDDQIAFLRGLLFQILHKILEI